MAAVVLFFAQYFIHTSSCRRIPGGVAALAAAARIPMFVPSRMHCLVPHRIHITCVSRIFNDIRENIALKPLENVAASLYFKKRSATHIHKHSHTLSFAARAVCIYTIIQFLGEISLRRRRVVFALMALTRNARARDGFN
jgi:hypothetical protein